MILEAMEKVLRDHCTAADIRRIASMGADAALWRNVEEAGFLDLLQGEAQGGAGMSLGELFPVLQCLGRFAVPLPVAQSIVARALLGGRQVPSGKLALATQSQRPDAHTLVCHHVPHGAVADHVLACDGPGLVLLACAGAKRVGSGDTRNLAATLTWRHALPVLVLPEGAEQLTAFVGALAAAQLSGAMQRAFEMSLDYCNTRVQFGKALGKFQAVQQQLSVMAEHVLAGAIAAESAYRGHGGVPSLLASAIAKSRASEAAGVVAATAHAVHGAIGMTDEYELGILTRHLHHWRAAFGAENHWNRIIGEQLLASTASVADFVRSV